MKPLKAFSLFCMVHLFAIILASPFASANTQAQDAKSKADAESEKKMSAIVDTILSTVTKSSCEIRHFGYDMQSKNFFGITKLDFGCSLLFDSDLRYNLTTGEVERFVENVTKDKKNDDSNKEKFLSHLILKTNGTLVDLNLNISEATGKAHLDFRFFGGIDRKAQRLVEKPLTAIFSNKLNKSLITLNLISIEVNAKRDPNNSKLFYIDGNCQSTQTIYNFLTGKPESKLAACSVQGTYDLELGLDLKGGYDQQPQNLQVVP